MASTALQSSVYMDDLLFGGDTIEEVRQLQKDIKDILLDAKMIMCRWMSNEDPLFKEFNGTHCVLIFRRKGLSEFINSASSCVRSLLGVAARLSDPLGFLSPFVFIQDVQK